MSDILSTDIYIQSGVIIGWVSLRLEGSLLGNEKQSLETCVGPLDITKRQVPS